MEQTVTLTQNMQLIDGVECFNPDIAQAYSDYPSEGFDVIIKLEEENFWCRARNRILKYIITKFANQIQASPVRFLELGCGTGYFLEGLSQDKQFSITGSDIYLAALKYAKARMPFANFIQLDATQNAFPNQYDIIGAFDVIEHIEDDGTVIANVYQSLVKEGYFIIAVPQYPFLWSRLDEIVKHKRRYTRSTLITKLEKAGFKVKFKSSFIFTLFPLMLVSRLLERFKKSSPASDAEQFEQQLKLPSFINWLFGKLTYLDELLIRWGVPLPVGGTLIVVAQKTH